MTLLVRWKIWRGCSRPPGRALQARRPHVELVEAPRQRLVLDDGIPWRLAISLIFSDTWSAPFATIRGADIDLSSYRRATARWTGFVMTTVAFGTSFIIRLRAISFIRLGSAT